MTVGTTVALATALSVLLGANNATDTITATGGGYYKVLLPQASTLLLKLNSLTANLDLEVVNSTGTVLTDANGQSLTSSNPNVLPEQIEAYNLAAGTYYVHIKNPTGSTSAPFRLTATANLSPDLVWRNTGVNTASDPDAGKTETWKMGGATSPNQVKIAKQSTITLPYFLEANWQVAGNGDFNQDGYNDLVWRNYSTGVNAVWLMNANGSYNQSIDLPTLADPNWQLGGVDDFNQDGKPDLVWRYQGTGVSQGDNAIWLMNGISGSSISIATSSYITNVSDLNWRIGGTGDFNQDGKPDIIFQNSNAAGPAVAFWYMDGTTFISSAFVTGVTIPAAPWYVFGSGHFNNDAKPDLLWGTYGASPEMHAVWTMDNTVYKAGYFLNPDNTNTNWVTRDAFPGWTAPSAIDEAGDTVASATSLGSLGSSTFTYGGFVGTAGDVDVYSFTTTARKQISLTAANLSTAAVNYTLKNSSGTTVATANSLTTPSASVSLPAGTYTITVSQASSVESRYSFTANIADPTPVLVSTNAPGSDGLTVANSMTVGGVDYFLSIGNSPGLYKTDGTSAGTVKLSALTPSFPYDLVQLGSAIFFTANDEATGTELYKTDGTVAGTVRVADIQAGLGSSVPSGLTVLGTKVYFAADDGTTGSELWSSDGTAVGTTRAANINTTPVTTGVPSPDQGSFPSSLKVMGTSLYFAADDGTTGNELWQYNGTTASQVKNLYTGSDIDGIPFSANPENLTANGTNLYFSAYTPASGQELFISDGTSTGTVAVNINAGAADSNPESFAVMGGNVFVAATGSSGRELYKVSGSTPTLVADLNTTGSSEPEELTTIGSTLWFTAQKDASTGYEVFRTDGTNILNSGNPWDINPGTGSSSAGGFTQVGADVYFTADNGTNGFELMKSAGGTGTPALLKNINTVATVPNASTDLGSFPYQVQPLSSSSFVFFASTNAAGTQLYNSNGSSAGTVITKTLDTSPRTSPSIPIAVDGANGVLLSLRYTPNEGQELYAGGTLLKDINPGVDSSQISELTVFNGASYFSAFDGTSTNLWKTDGTVAGTQKVAAESAIPSNLTAGYYSTGTPPWTGAPIGVTTGNASWYYTLAVPNGGGNVGLFYTVAVPNGVNTEIHLKLLKTNGAVTDVKTLNTTGSPVLEMTGTRDNGLLFSNDDGSHGQEPWVSDGTTAGTRLLKDVNPGANGSYPYSFSNSSNAVVSNYSASEQNKCYGQPVGTYSYRDCLIGHSKLTFFLADDGSGVGLFSTDGQQDSDTVVPISPQAMGGNNQYVFGRATGTARETAMDYVGSGSSGNNMEISQPPRMYSEFFGLSFLTAYQSDTVAYEPKLFYNKPILFTNVFTAPSGSVAPTNSKTVFIAESFDINPNNGQGSGARDFTSVNPGVYPSTSEPLYNVFNADNGSTGSELFVAKTTKLVGFYACGSPSTCVSNSTTMSLAADLFTGTDANGAPNSSNPRDFVWYNNAVYFLADTASGTQLYQCVPNGASGVTVGVLTTLPTGNTPINLTLQGSTLQVTTRFPVAGQADQFNTFAIAL